MVIALVKELFFDLSQARTVRRVRQELESWSPPAKGQIIAQKFIKPIVCHAGYDIDGTKEAILWANNVDLSGHFEIIDVITNKQPPAVPSIVYRGDFKKWGFHPWGGNNYKLDFTDFKREGLYWIEVKIPKRYETAVSYIFKIKKNLYLDLALKAAKWFYYQRCGTEVPGWHGACHTEDAIILDDGTKMDATGGWHDAGDYGKWIGSGAYGVWALTILAEILLEFGYEREAHEVLEEALWEGEYFSKVYYKRLGTFLQVFTSTKNFALSDEFPPLENVCVWLGSPEKEPSRIVTLKQTLSYYPPSHTFRAQVAMSLAKLGRSILRYNRHVSDRYISIAEEVYDYIMDSKPSDSDLQRYLNFQSSLLMLSIELYKALEDRKYLRTAEKCVKEILPLQDERGYFYIDRNRASKYLFCDYHVIGLYEFANLDVNENLKRRSLNAFKRWIDLVASLTYLSPFGQVGTLDEKGNPRNLGRHPSSRFLGSYAWGLATASMLFNDPKFLRMAEHQIQWILGFNPRDVSLMAGVGRGPGCYHHRYCFIEGHEDGVVPGGILNGIVGGDGKKFDIGDFRTANFIVSDRLPVDYPLIDMDVWGWTYAYLTNEYWVRNNASFIIGAAQVQKAIRRLKSEGILD